MGSPYVLVDRLDTPDQVTNGGFEQGLRDWRLWVNAGDGAAAHIEIAEGQGVSGTNAAHIVVTQPNYWWDVKLQQTGKSTIQDQPYTVSFAARSSVTQTFRVRIAQVEYPGADYGFNVFATVTPQWQRFVLWGAPTVTADGGEIEFHLGETAGELWLDDIRFQQGALGVWAREFTNGLVVANATPERQAIPLPATFCKLHGNQAPLYQARLDDDQADLSTGWENRPAAVDQFGWTVHAAAKNSATTAVYSPSLPYAGAYEVLAWVAPQSGQNPHAQVEIEHAGGASTVYLDQTTGDAGWRSLGTYTFDKGTSGSAMLRAAGAGTTIADVFKWVSVARYNDGEPVSRIELEPYDAMILLKTCTADTRELFLPMIVSIRDGGVDR